MEKKNDAREKINRRDVEEGSGGERQKKDGAGLTKR